MNIDKNDTNNVSAVKTTEDIDIDKNDTNNVSAVKTTEDTDIAKNDTNNIATIETKEDVDIDERKVALFCGILKFILIAIAVLILSKMAYGLFMLIITSFINDRPTLSI